MIDEIRSKIRYQAQELGLRFDDSEIIAIPFPLEGSTVVCLRSVKSTRQVEQEDGTLLYDEQGEPVIEEFNDPIIWIDYYSPHFSSSIQGEKLQITATAPKPKVTIKFPELVYQIKPSPL